MFSLYAGRVVLMALLLAPFAINTFSQDEEIKDPIHWSLKITAPAQSFKAGERFTVEIAAKIDKGWHLYSLKEIEQGPRPTRLSLPADQGFKLAGDIEAPDPESAYDKNFEVETEFYEDSVTFKLPVRVADSAVAGANRLRVQVRYQMCSDKLCLPPKLINLETAVDIQQK